MSVQWGTREGERMSIGVWQLILIALILAIVVGIPAHAIATDRTDRSIQRNVWWQWTGIYVGFLIVVWLLEQLADKAVKSPGQTVVAWTYWAVLMVMSFILPWLMARRFLWRVRDAGWKPKLAYLFILPLINFIPWLLLLFLPTASTPQENSSNQ